MVLFLKSVALIIKIGLFSTERRTEVSKSDDRLPWLGRPIINTGRMFPEWVDSFLETVNRIIKLSPPLNAGDRIFKIGPRFHVNRVDQNYEIRLPHTLGGPA